MRMSKATASTVIATGNLRQGRLMAGHGGLYSNAKLRQIGAKDGHGGMRARCFSYCEGGKRRGTVVLNPCGPAARSDPPVFSSGPHGASCAPRVPSGPSGVSLDPPVCPPVPLVSLGSYSSIVIVQL
jgi:hypothetical protein